MSIQIDIGTISIGMASTYYWLRDPLVLQDSTIPPEEETYVLYNGDEIVKDTLDTLDKAMT